MNVGGFGIEESQYGGVHWGGSHQFDLMNAGYDFEEGLFLDLIGFRLASVGRSALSTQENLLVENIGFDLLLLATKGGKQKLQVNTPSGPVNQRSSLKEVQHLMKLYKNNPKLYKSLRALEKVIKRLPHYLNKFQEIPIFMFDPKIWEDDMWMDESNQQARIRRSDNGG